MSKRTRRVFSDEQKQSAVEDYLSGRKTAAQVAAENDVPVGVIYKWRVQLDERAKSRQIEDLEAQGATTQMARKILQQQAEIEAYQKKVAEQAVIIDLLKKLQTPRTSPPESELTGLIRTTQGLARNKKPVK